MRTDIKVVFVLSMVPSVDLGRTPWLPIVRLPAIDDKRIGGEKKTCDLCLVSRWCTHRSDNNKKNVRPPRIIDLCYLLILSGPPWLNLPAQEFLTVRRE